MLAGNVLWSLGMCCPVWSHCNRLREPTSRRSVCSCQVRTPFAARARLLQSGVHRLLCGRPAPGRSSCSCQARTPFAARARLLREGAHLLVWEARLGTKLLLLPGRTPFAARARLLRAGMHICLCGRPALGAKLLLAQARTPFAARARLLHSGVHGLLLWEARPRGEAFIA